jgi:hypothetical protein
VVNTVASVAEQVHPVAVQFGVELTGSPPLPLQEGVQIKSRLAFQHVVDGPSQFVSKDGQGFPLAVFFLSAGEEFLGSGIVTQEYNGRFGNRPFQMRIANVAAGGAGAFPC